MNSSRHEHTLATALAIGAPLALAALEMFHPHPHELFQLNLNLWLAVHYLQLPLMPLAAVAMTALVRDFTGLAAALCRAGMFVFAVSYTAFDTAAGIVTAFW
jgi:hypothetical protein